VLIAGGVACYWHSQLLHSGGGVSTLVNERVARPLRYAWYGLWLAHIGALTYVWYDLRGPTLAGDGGTALVSIGALFGLYAMFAFITQYILMSGIAPLERPFGLDRLIRLHHVNGFLGWGLLFGHIPLILLGYGQSSGLPMLAQLRELMGVLPYVTLAVIADILLQVVFVSSIVIVRRRLRYEWWRTTHFLVYGVFILAFWHQLANGQELLVYPWLRRYWIVLFILALVSVAWRRYARPMVLYARYRFRVSKVTHEVSGVTSVYVTGRNLETFHYQAGQFAFWYFWQRGFRTQKHPFTISSSPSDPYLRLSAKAIGDYSAQLPELAKDTPVFINGPYGRFTTAVQAQPKRLFIAGGIGITPIRSMLGAGRQPGDILLYSARTPTDLAFYKEIESWRQQGLQVGYFVGEKAGLQPHMRLAQIDAASIQKAAPDVAQRDVWLCGPPAMMDAIEKALVTLCVPKRQIHTERFRL
jgi:predicted ferric reductase